MTTRAKPNNLKEFSGDFSMAGSRRMEAPGNIRFGGSTYKRGYRRSVVDDSKLSDEERQSLYATLPKAVAVYMPMKGKLLAVSRSHDASDLNMPGGLVDPGEDPQVAAARELYEETGYVADEMFPIFTKVNNGYLVTTYKVTKFHGDLRSSWEGVATWTDPKTLTKTTFKRYFNAMMEHLSGDALSECVHVPSQPIEI